MFQLHDHPVASDHEVIMLPADSIGSYQIVARQSMAGKSRNSQPLTVVIKRQAEFQPLIGMPPTAGPINRTVVFDFDHAKEQTLIGAFEKALAAVSPQDHAVEAAE